MVPALGPLAPTADHTITSVERSTGAGSYYAHVDDDPASGQPDADYLGIRSAAFVPTQLTGLVLWADASDTATITQSAGLVSQINDKGPAGNNLVQATGADKPTTGTRTQNGLNVLDFITNDRLSKATTPTLNASTIFVVALFDTAPGTTHLFGSNATNNYNHGVGGTGGNRSLINRGTQVTAGSTSVSASTPYVLTYTNAAGGGASSGNAWVNTTQTITAANPGTLNSVGIRVGTNQTGVNGLDGWVGEVVVYDSVLGTTDREACRDYLKTKWAVY